MKLEKDFNPGQNNTYNEYNINIGTVQNFNPNATTVNNTYYGTSPMQPENAEGESKPAGNLFDRLKMTSGSKVTNGYGKRYWICRK